MRLNYDERSVPKIVVLYWSFGKSVLQYEAEGYNIVSRLRLRTSPFLCHEPLPDPCLTDVQRVTGWCHVESFQRLFAVERWPHSTRLATKSTKKE
jgi:hypothetical protein